MASSSPSSFPLRRLISLVPEPKQRFGVKTFNVLADKCADQSPQGFPHVPAEILEWDYRKNLIRDEIFLEHPDFITLQEVDHYDDWFKPLFEERGYDSFSSRDCVIAWDRSVWRPVEADSLQSRILEGGSQAFIFGYFISTEDENSVIVGTTHLKAKPEFVAVRKQQVIHIMKILEEYVLKLPVHPRIVITGDFNATPDEICVKLFAQDYLSVYNDGNSENYTTLKYRSSLVKREIDYIWFTDDLKLVKQLEIPDASQFPSPYLPSAAWPSDHLSLMAVFEF